MAGVVTGGVARDHGHVTGKQIDDATLTLVTPLTANNDCCGHKLPRPPVGAVSSVGGAAALAGDGRIIAEGRRCGVEQRNNLLSETRISDWCGILNNYLTIFNRFHA
jgi:hypothetical protein